MIESEAHQKVLIHRIFGEPELYAPDYIYFKALVQLGDDVKEVEMVTTEEQYLSAKKHLDRLDTVEPFVLDTGDNEQQDWRDS